MSRINLFNKAYGSNKSTIHDIATDAMIDELFDPALMDLSPEGRKNVVYGLAMEVVGLSLIEFGLFAGPPGLVLAAIGGGLTVLSVEVISKGYGEQSDQKRNSDFHLIDPKDLDFGFSRQGTWLEGTFSLSGNRSADFHLIDPKDLKFTTGASVIYSDKSAHDKSAHEMRDSLKDLIDRSKETKRVDFSGKDAGEWA